ncbi:MAG: bifunctional phosphopantothenoylcysteine decarboxylase/phosphopantothenate--cysteine ligase CoaBC [bacterium]
MEQRLKNKKILLGVTGSIAAYKACMVVRELQFLGAEVKVVMTQSAQEFINPLTFESLTKHEVVTRLFPDNRSVKTRHISYAEWADLVLICPATANIIGKVASGIADDFLSTVIMASRAPVMFAPAMDLRMVQNKIYLSNCHKLESFGYTILSTERGELASGLSGKGRLADPRVIVNYSIQLLLGSTDLKGKKIVVTAGPTREPLDPVRYLTNRSTGKMGFALAEEVALRGAEVCLISGPSHLIPVNYIKYIEVETAEQMTSAVLKESEDSHAVIMAAAVADYTPGQISGQKIKKRTDNFTLKLKKTVDILSQLGKNKQNRILVGFSLETENTRENTIKKLQKKNLDMICLNNPSDKGGGFGTETNKLTLFYPHKKKKELLVMPKWKAAEIIVDEIEGMLNLGNS